MSEADEYPTVVADLMRSLIFKYNEDWKNLKDEDPSLGNLDFNKKYGLWLNVPNNDASMDPKQESWTKCLEDAVLSLADKESNEVAIIYPAGEDYNRLRSTLEIRKHGTHNIKFMGWSEIFVAIHSPGNTGGLDKVRKLLQDSALVLVVGASQTATDVLDHIQLYTMGCLICIN